MQKTCLGTPAVYPLLSVVGKVLWSILLDRLLSTITDMVLPEPCSRRSRYDLFREAATEEMCRANYGSLSGLF